MDCIVTRSERNEIIFREKSGFLDCCYLARMKEKERTQKTPLGKHNGKRRKSIWRRSLSLTFSLSLLSLSLSLLFSLSLDRNTSRHFFSSVNNSEWIGSS